MIRADTELIGESISDAPTENQELGEEQEALNNINTKELLLEDEHHEVYLPERASIKRKKCAQFGSIAETSFQNDENTYLHRQTTLKERQQNFNYHVQVSKEMVKETTEELINSNEIRPQKRLRGFTFKLSQKVQRQRRMTDLPTNTMAHASGATATAVHTPSSRETKKEHVEGSIIPVPVEELPNLKKRASRVRII